MIEELEYTYQWKISYNNGLCLFSIFNSKWTSVFTTPTELLRDFDLEHRAETVLLFHYEKRGNRILPIEKERIKIYDTNNQRIEPAYSLSI